MVCGYQCFFSECFSSWQKPSQTQTHVTLRHRKRPHVHSYWIDLSQSEIASWQTSHSLEPHGVWSGVRDVENIWKVPGFPSAALGLGESIPFLLNLACVFVNTKSPIIFIGNRQQCCVLKSIEHRGLWERLVGWSRRVVDRCLVLII